MSLNSAIQSALSGLSLASRAAMTVSSNVANATTEGYARRELEVVARDGQRGAPGVKVVTENRIIDAGLLGERRRTDAETGDARARAEAMSRLEVALGVPGTPGALTTRIADLSAALTEAESRPDSLPRQETVLHTARGLAEDIAGLGRLVQDSRSAADAELAAAVGRLNDGLEEVHRLGRLIQREIASGQVPNGLFDERQRVIDGLAELVPLREVARPGGQVVLYTDNGAILFDGRPARIGFDSLGGPLEPQVTVADGGLSGLSIDGVPIRLGPGGPLSGGRIEGLLAVRDTLMPQAQAGLDRLAADLIRRFEIADAASPAPSGLGLLTDAGQAWDPEAPPGLAQRLTLNPRADPTQPEGALWRLRDGLGAEMPGLPGDSRGLAALSLALESQQAAPGTTGPGRSLAGHAAEFAAGIGRLRDLLELDEAAGAARNTALRDAEAANGVDTDTEMQKLLLIERAYAANARVLKAADEMIQQLLAI